MAWHRTLFLSVFLLLAAVAGWTAFQYPGVVHDLQGRAKGQAKGNNVEAVSGDKLAEDKDQWLTPAPWKMADNGNQLFTPRRLLYFTATQKVELATPQTMVGQIPLDWLLKNGLNASDPDIEGEDADGDGFTNLEEFLMQTDSRNPNSHPSYIKLVRLQSSEAKPFRMTFSSKNVVGDETDFQINTPDGKRSSYTVKAGQVFEGFKVMGFQAKEGTRKIGNMEVEGDISELTLENQTTGETVVLTYRVEKNEPSVTGVFVLLLTNAYSKPITVAKGKDFTFQASPKPEIPVETLHLRFLSLDGENAVVQNMDTNEKVTIPKLKPGELERFTAPPKTGS